MALHPDLVAFLELAEAGIAAGRLPMYEQTPAQARIDYDRASLLLDDPNVHPVDVREISISCRDSQSIAARLYIPNNLQDHVINSALPVLMFFHGGGYCVGSLDSHDGLCRSLAHLTPCAVLAVDYRLAPEHKFPTAVHDAEDAYYWLLSQGRSHELDITRIAVGGDSAGGTLATALAIYARDAALPKPLLQVLLYPCTSATQDTLSHRQFSEGYLLESKTLQWMFNHYLRDDDDRKDWRFAPLETDDLTHLPPAFVALAQYDLLIDEGVAYAERLQADNIDTTLKIYRGMTHDFARFGNIVADAERVREDIALALAKVFYGYSQL